MHLPTTFFSEPHFLEFVSRKYHMSRPHHWFVDTQQSGRTSTTNHLGTLEDADAQQSDSASTRNPLGILQEAHHTLVRGYVSHHATHNEDCWTGGFGDRYLNERFQVLDIDYPDPVSYDGFSSLLTTSFSTPLLEPSRGGGCITSQCDPPPQEHLQQLFTHYGIEGRGSLDMTAFLAGLRYNLGLEAEDTQNVLGKVRQGFAARKGATNPPAAKPLEREATQHKAKPARDDDAVPRVADALTEAGFPETVRDVAPPGACPIAEAVFVRTMRRLTGPACTTSELVFLFSTLARTRREARVDLRDVGRLFARVCFCPRPPLLDYGGLISSDGCKPCVKSVSSVSTKGTQQAEDSVASNRRPASKQVAASVSSEQHFFLMWGQPMFVPFPTKCTQMNLN